MLVELTQAVCVCDLLAAETEYLFAFKFGYFNLEGKFGYLLWCNMFTVLILQTLQSWTKHNLFKRRPNTVRDLNWDLSILILSLLISKKTCLCNYHQ